MKQNDALNPIVDQHPARWSPFGSEFATSSGHTAVVHLAGATPGDVAPRPLGHWPTFLDRWRWTLWQYEIDMSCHWTALTLSLPSREEAFVFRTWVSLTWQVSDPVAVATSGVEDVRPIIWALLDQQLRVVSRHFSIEDAGAAEEEMGRVLEGKLGDVGFGIRLVLLSVNVRLDEAAERYLVTRVESRRARHLAVDEHELEKRRRAHAAELAELAGALERQQVEHTAALERMRSDSDRRLAAVTAKHELELRRQRVEFYRSALRSGESDVLVLYLSEHPQDVQTVVTMLDQARAEGYQRSKELLKALFDQGLINAAEAEPMREHVMESLRSGAGPSSVTLKRERATRHIEEQTETESVELS